MASSDTLAMVAIGTSGLVGLAGVVVPALTSGRRQRSEHEAERQREVRAVRRQLLDDGAILLRRLKNALSAFKFVPDEPGQVTAESAIPMDELMPDMAAHNARMQLWFPADSEVYKAWVNAQASIGAHGIVQDKETKDRLEVQLAAGVQKYADAARAYVVKD